MGEYLPSIDVGRKHVDIFVEDDPQTQEKVAYIKIKNNDNFFGGKGDTTELYNRVAELLSQYASENNIVVRQVFTTTNENMKHWFKSNADAIGFSNIREAEGIIRGEKEYRPEKKKNNPIFDGLKSFFLGD